MKTHLVFAVMAALLLAFVISQGKRKTLTFENVIEQAGELAKEDYIPAGEVSSQVLRGLNYDQYRDIRWRDEHTLWRRLGLPFQTKFFPAGHIHSKPVTIYQVNRDGAGPVRFDPAFFDFGKNNIPPSEAAKGGYAGFRVHYPINRADYLDEAFVFLGASYFRAVAKDQAYGISARGLAIGTLEKEEFPDFTTFWLVEPAQGATGMKIYALLEGKSITGAYEFQIFPGAETRMDVRAVLFPRRDIKSPGVAPLTSMFWFGENTNNTFGDFRPEVHDSDGLQIERGNGEWLWRPLSWAKQLQVSVFEDENPRGFGLLQRDRDFSHYQDMEARYHQRPCVWVRPRGAWGKGAIHLIQLPTNNEFMDNVVAYWLPEGGFQKGTRREFSYSLTWFGTSPAIPPLGRCEFTRVDFQDAPYYRMFVLDFSGAELSKLSWDAPVTADVSAGGGAIKDVVVQKNNYGDSWRVSFIASSDQPAKPTELRCTLRIDGRPITETWTTTWKN
ncbi:MAG: glucans biosynthesis protein [Verrucomicrobiaceae bacterium]|nr:MAG: glucans biosynthesis protein [Verrucomicrobiaceae bacterium]